jgi:methenyltetrahydromethanopterin cyclohydrolase
MNVNLNRRAMQRCEELVERSSQAKVAVSREESGSRLIDCGVHAPGGLEAGRAMAEICMADLGHVDLVPAAPRVWPGLAVSVRTDHPAAACMAAQYAGWQIAGDKFFAMGSGPMRAARGKEKLFDRIGFLERPTSVVGVLESAKLPPRDVCHHIAEECHVEPEQLTLLVAPTASLAGSIQVVARSIETSLHKLHELGFDVRRVASGFGIAPLPPVAADDLAGIGRTNDAVLYGAEVTLYITGDDDVFELGPKIPSSASPDHGQPFAEIFRRYKHDFYQIDPLLFSPAVVTIVNVDSGRARRFGEISPDVLQRSFLS